MGDLENIEETETPPQSPTEKEQSKRDAVTILPPIGISVQYTKVFIYPMLNVIKVDSVLGLIL